MDIAAGLSRECRYAGQLVDDVDFYSTAEHSVLMTRFAVDRGIARFREDALAIQVHDAAEFVLKDLTTPVKQRCPAYKAFEALADEAIAEAFGLHGDPRLIGKPVIKSLDLRIRIDERRELIAEPAMSAGLDVIWENTPHLEPLGVWIEGMMPTAARLDFLETFVEMQALPLRNRALGDVLARHVDAALEKIDYMKSGRRERDRRMRQDRHAAPVPPARREASPGIAEADAPSM